MSERFLADVEPYEQEIERLKAENTQFYKVLEKIISLYNTDNEDEPTLVDEINDRIYEVAIAALGDQHE